MFGKSIKTKSQQTKVVKELVNDLHSAVDYFGGYVVRNEDNEKAVVFSESLCFIITTSALENIMEVYTVYKMMYPSVSMHLDVAKCNDVTVPAVEIVVGMR